MTAAALRHLLDPREHHVLNPVTNLLAPTSCSGRTAHGADAGPGPLLAAGSYDLRVVDGSCGPLDEDVWERVVALRRETQDEQPAEDWREWAQALRDGVDAGLVRLLLVMDGPRLVWFAAVAIAGEVSLPQPHVRTRGRSTASLPC